MPRRSLRRTPQTIAIAVLSGTALIGAGGVADAQAAAPKIVVKGGVTQPVFSYKDAIREYVYVESSLDSDGDGKRDRVRVDIVRPKETQKGLKSPVIIDNSPYFDNLGRGNEAEKKTYDAAGNPLKFPLFYDNYFVPRGYAYLAIDMIGTTKSDGCPGTGQVQDIAGGKAVIDWLNGRGTAYGADGKKVKASWHNGRSGMIGKSYDGTLANGVAATGVKGLSTIVPISAISSWYEYIRSNGAKFANNYHDYLAKVVDNDPDAKCEAVRQALHVGEDDATGNYNKFFANSNYRHGTYGDVRKVRASVFVIHTVNDLNVQPVHFSRWWDGLKKQGVKRKIWVGQYGHTDPFDFRRETWVPVLHRWFDSELFKINNGVHRTPKADVEVAPGQWIKEPDWPAARSRKVALRPGTGGSLGLKAAPKGSTASFTDTEASEADLVADPTTAKPYRLAYVSQPLPGNARLSGTPVADLKVKLDKPTSNLTAMLVDYGTDARVDYLGARGGLDELPAEDCWGESIPADDACYKKTPIRTVTSPVNVVARGWIDAQNRLSLTNPTPLTPGKFHRVKWQTLPQDYVFKKGHRLALVIAGTDTDYLAETATGAQVTVDLAGSSITVPVVFSGSGASALAAPQTKSAWRGPTKVNIPVQSRELK
ncbi:Xaa-Pro dipeptidyl-peptidase [Actinomadura rudentiformis]|uniref:Xaa-Pro dipeptidyl-peptidase n=1 Tax=Actinomadura rudentiformis TaxID=359158 RepID=UPI001CEFA909|nr:Xaa-Pro dipeptidyl-peptidase [Actinomadura rudentiformis]